MLRLSERTPTASYLSYRYPHHKDLALSVSTTERERESGRQMDHDATTLDSAVMVFSTRFIERAIERALGLSIQELKDSSRYLRFRVFRCDLRRFERQGFQNSRMATFSRPAKAIHQHRGIRLDSSRTNFHVHFAPSRLLFLPLIDGRPREKENFYEAPTSKIKHGVLQAVVSSHR